MNYCKGVAKIYGNLKDHGGVMGFGMNYVNYILFNLWRCYLGGSQEELWYHRMLLMHTDMDPHFGHIIHLIIKCRIVTIVKCGNHFCYVILTLILLLIYPKSSLQTISFMGKFINKWIRVWVSIEVIKCVTTRRQI